MERGTKRAPNVQLFSEAKYGGYGNGFQRAILFSNIDVGIRETWLVIARRQVLRGKGSLGFAWVRLGSLEVPDCL